MFGSAAEFATRILGAIKWVRVFLCCRHWAATAARLGGCQASPGPHALPFRPERAGRGSSGAVLTQGVCLAEARGLPAACTCAPRGAC
eukprot:9494380-Lingulodinium_polyedra.AAC.1